MIQRQIPYDDDETFKYTYAGRVVDTGVKIKGFIPPPWTESEANLRWRPFPSILKNVTDPKVIEFHWKTVCDREKYPWPFCRSELILDGIIPEDLDETEVDREYAIMNIFASNGYEWIHNRPTSEMDPYDRACYLYYLKSAGETNTF